ncbi:hypothetical protein FRC10_011459 [Ceratobasidium sp. 414]|nr:hypothetical protein FRC10_011459 [Ceratobasidium sp. 414]
MTDHSYGRGKRAHVPNVAIQTHLATVQRTHATVENNRRKAAIKEQRVVMAAEKAAKKQGAPAKAASKTTSASSGIRNDTGASPEHDPIKADLEEDEAACKYLMRKILQRDKTRDVKYLDLDELEAMWEEMQREGSAPVLEKPAPVLKKPTPALKKNPNIQTMGIIDLATSSAPSKSTATAKRSLPKQDPPRGSASSAPSKSITAGSHAKSSQSLLPSKPTESAPKPAVSSSVPRVSGKGKHPPTTPNARFEEIVLDDDNDGDNDDDDADKGGDQPEVDDDQVEDEEPPVEAKRKKSKGSRKATKDYADPMEKEVIGVACEHLAAKALKVGMCVGAAKQDPLIRECWNLAIEELGLEEGQYPCTHQHCETVKTRLQSFRSHSRNRALSIAPSIFGFNDRPLKERGSCAAKLLPTEFLRDPKAKSGGKYQHPFIVDLLAHSLLKGRKPPGQRYPEYFTMMPLDTIAFACAMMQFALEQIQLCLPKADKLDFMAFQSRFNVHLHSLQTFQKEKPIRVEYIQKVLWKKIVESVGKDELLGDPSEPPQGALTAREFDDEEEPTAEELASLNLVASQAGSSRHATRKGNGKAHGPSVEPNDENHRVFYDGAGTTNNVARTWSPPPVRLDDEDDDDGAGPGPSASASTHKPRDDSDSDSSSSSSDSESTSSGSDASEKRKTRKDRKKRKERRKERRRARRVMRKERKEREACEREQQEEDGSEIQDGGENPPSIDVDLPRADDKGGEPGVGGNAEGAARGQNSPVGEATKEQAVPGTGSGDVFGVGDGAGGGAGDMVMDDDLQAGDGDRSSPTKKVRPKKRKMIFDSDDEPESEPEVPTAGEDTVKPDAQENKRAKSNAKGKQIGAPYLLANNIVVQANMPI